MGIDIEYAHMSDAKEPKSINQVDGWSVGDKVRINSFYLNNYCGMSHLSDNDATVVKVTARSVRYDQLDTIEGRPRFVAKYGKKDVYDLVCLWIRYPDDNRSYIVSPFGYDKV